MENLFSRRDLDNSRTHTLQGLSPSELEIESDISWTSDPDETTYGDPKLIAIIGDEDTCVGFILAGIGQLDENMAPNYFVVDQKTDDFKLELVFLDILERPDIGLVLITREAANKISPIINRHKGLDPTVMVIPGHNGPFEFELPIAVKDIEERRLATSNMMTSKTGSVTSIKTLESVHGAILSRKLSTHSIRSNRSTKSLKL